MAEVACSFTGRVAEIAYMDIQLTERQCGRQVTICNSIVCVSHVPMANQSD